MPDLHLGVGLGSIGTTVDLGLLPGTAAASSGTGGQQSGGLLGGVGLGVDVGVGSTGTAAGAGGSGLGVDVGLGLGGSGGTSTGSGATGTGGSGLGVDVGVSLGGSGSGGATGGGTGSGGTIGVGVGVNVGGSGAGGGDGTGSGATGTGGGGAGGTGDTGSVGGVGATGTGAAGVTPDPQTAFMNIFRLGGAADISASDQARLSTLEQQVSQGVVTGAQAVRQVADWAAGTTAVAETSYQFFSGLTPTADGLTYLVHSPNNGADLSDPYYSSFNLENRYINFASNLGLHSDYAPAFAQVFGPMTFQQAVATAYDRIVGDADATAAGVDPQAAIADIISRQPYFQAVAQERFGAENQDLSTKLAAIAYIMEESVRADVGHYGEANLNFLTDLADGKAQFHVDLVGVYQHPASANLTT